MYCRIPRVTSTFARRYSAKGSFQRINSAINKIGDENAPQSATALRIFRKIGGASVVIVLCLLFWASSLNVKELEPELVDLTQDVRDE